MNDTPSVQIAITRGAVPERIAEQARTKVASLLRLAPAPVLFAQVTLAHEAARHQQRRASARAVLDVNGTPVRAHVTAHTCTEAVDLLEAKLRHGLEVLTEHRQARRHEPSVAAPGSWRHGSLPDDRHGWFPRPADERDVVDHGSYVTQPATVTDAAADLDLLEQDWVLFTEATTGADALLERTTESYRLVIEGHSPPDVGELHGVLEVRLDVPHISLATAIEMLDQLDVPKLFFTDEGTGRGCVVYRRYDGHLGTVRRVGEPSTPNHERSRT